MRIVEINCPTAEPAKIRRLVTAMSRDRHAQEYTFSSPEDDCEETLFRETPVTLSHRGAILALDWRSRAAVGLILDLEIRYFDP